MEPNSFAYEASNLTIDNNTQAVTRDTMPTNPIKKFFSKKRETSPNLDASEADKLKSKDLRNSFDTPMWKIKELPQSVHEPIRKEVVTHNNSLLRYMIDKKLEKNPSYNEWKLKEKDEAQKNDLHSPISFLKKK